MRNALFIGAVLTCATAIAVGASTGSGAGPGQMLEGKRLFEQETFGGNGRTCQTCHGPETGTVSPEDAQKRFAKDPQDPLFVHDGSDDGQGKGTSRMRRDATVLMTIEMAKNVQLADDPSAKTVVLMRGIPTTLNTPALDAVLMVDGRQPTLERRRRARFTITRRARSFGRRPCTRSRRSRKRTRSSARPRFADSRSREARLPHCRRDRPNRKSAVDVSSRTCHRIRQRDFDRACARTATAAR